MKNFVQPGQSITTAPAAAVSSGGVLRLGARIGVALANVPANVSGVFSVEGVYRLPKLAADAIGVGDAVRWDHLQGVITTATVGAGNAVIVSAGFAYSAAAAGETFVDVKINA
jgi:predicted RecA/RadA family phage recombinase